MGPKRSLPVSAPLPTVDAVRRRLGGRASTGPGAGEIVRLRTASGLEVLGVVVFSGGFSGGDEVDVFTTDDAGLETRAHRTRRDRVAPLGERAADAAVPPVLRAVAADAAAFAALREGERVRFSSGPREGEGTLVEKCRYGALVLCDDGKVVGASFRRVSSAPDAERN